MIQWNIRIIGIIGMDLAIRAQLTILYNVSRL